MPVLEGIVGISATILRDGRPVGELNDHPWIIKTPMTATRHIEADTGLEPWSIFMTVSKDYDFSAGQMHSLSFSVYVDGFCIGRRVCKPFDVDSCPWEETMTFGWYEIGSCHWPQLGKEFNLGPQRPNDLKFANFQLPRSNNPEKGTLEVRVHRSLDPTIVGENIAKAFDEDDETFFQTFHRNSAADMYPGEAIRSPFASFKFIFKDLDDLIAEGIDLQGPCMYQRPCVKGDYQNQIEKYGAIDVHKTWPQEKKGPSGWLIAQMEHIQFLEDSHPVRAPVAQMDPDANPPLENDPMYRAGWYAPTLYNQAESDSDDELKDDGDSRLSDPDLTCSQEVEDDDDYSDQESDDDEQEEEEDYSSSEDDDQDFYMGDLDFTYQTESDDDDEDEFLETNDEPPRKKQRMF
ncbi:hypothetical protein PFICI_11248 [Pestalotiopsis fici W106-1]|uniref:Uncharacterized protein n=1 Tax=Pestalotiopsis fici (strain W106-1 / CGMCC3.15140) TaxID=1229662 RepID=W3WUA4_PESFW|nr:uncharacterized protein PFICI_11248 [Pestalotiopsis fici W106-1]ETS77374.1 hypothetical protein PFICI_11248 [Pestalotiopsis fici W106-1]